MDLGQAIETAAVQHSTLIGLPIFRLIQILLIEKYSDMLQKYTYLNHK